MKWYLVETRKNGNYEWVTPMAAQTRDEAIAELKRHWQMMIGAGQANADEFFATNAEPYPQYENDPRPYTETPDLDTEEDRVTLLDAYGMTAYGKPIDDRRMSEIASYMDDDIREDLHGQLAPCDNEEFIAAYLERDPGFIELLKAEFDFEQL